MRVISEEYIQLNNRIKQLKSSHLNSILPFGKYKGKTLQWIKSYDVQYIYWLADNTDYPIDFDLLNLLTPEEKERKEKEFEQRERERQEEIMRESIRREQEKIEEARSLRGNYW